MRSFTAVLAALGVILNTCLVALALFVLTPLKALPIPAARKAARRWSASLAEGWIGINNFMVDRLPTRWEITLPEGLRYDRSYVICSNHQSWVDIVVLQRVFNRRVPFMRFFIKSQLIWVPVIGLAWWVLDFPFMKRYSRTVLVRRPELKGKDQETARKACEKFRELPTSMMNFLEGTRFTPAKREAQASPYQRLLLPRIGGVAQVLDSLGDSLHALLDVTIAYPGGRPTLWQFLRGEVEAVVVDVEVLDIPSAFRGKNLREDPEYRAALAGWVDEIWKAKDERLLALQPPPEDA